ncbi:Protein of unknown function [Paenibacillus algorifonticola]|uniref:DUF1064 domain-containing protein n=1 Tax=Paenibacillus algorifonticola TaxID=684063 RepID=A0A1I2AF32_9BACL|nr:DUF1064 domain-containing protein [Paenibacillus algorifonticola]SFE42482.1 Protein of unknown function [Paenibacillus algorifonticola]
MARFGTKAAANSEPKSKYNATKALLDLGKKTIVKLTSQQVKDMKEFGYDKESFIIFDSSLEARFYRDQLLPLVEEQSVFVEFQPKYVLQPKFEKEGMKHREITYSPDFKVTYFSGKVVLFDVKGAEDQKFPIKRKMFDYTNPDLPPLVVMKYVVKFGGWITIEEYAIKKREENKLKKAAAN